MERDSHSKSLSLHGRNSWLHSVNLRRVDFHRSCTARFEWLQSLPVYTLSLPPLSLGLLSTLQSLRTFHLTLDPLARCLFMQGSSLCTAGTPDGDGNTTHPLSLHDAGTCAARSRTLWSSHSSIMFGFQLTCQARVSVCEHVGAPRPMAHTGRPGDILSVCIAPAFRQVVRFGAPWPILFTCLCLFTPQLFAASAFSVFAFAVFPCSHGRTSVHAAASWHH